LEKVPAWCLEPRSSSTDLMRLVLVARELPVTMKALEVALGRHSRRLFLTLSGP